MLPWRGKSAAPAGSDAGAVGEVAVQKVKRIEFRSLLTRPTVYSAPHPRGGGGGTEGEDIDKQAEKFIMRQRKMWNHGQKSAGPASTRPSPPS
ncbi:uncharacterized protein LOC133928412 [Phragmites australis]|uniref:uncharacterized protein LOC133928412 n=1 Tax=Phragmites australis TaxID=29695 RepID=UPI002D78F30C|nr:uncharacterized protein LOC133928412 [Phragmites australis]